MNQKSSMILRIMAGIYLLYLSYSLIQEAGNTSSLFLVITAVTVFGAVGITLTAVFGWKLWKLGKTEKE